MVKKKRKGVRRMLFLDELPTFARELAIAIRPGDCICLTGEMGAGKTTFVRALLQEWGLGSDVPFSSPTFNILNSYNLNGLIVHHIDLYRLNNFNSFAELDLIANLEDPRAVTFVEWGNKFAELLPFYSKKVHFEYLRGKTLDRMLEYEGFN